MKLLLDTNAWTEFARGNSAVASRIAASEGVLMSAIVVGELLFGFRNGSRARQNTQILSTFLAEPTVEFVPVSFSTADWFGKLAAAQRRKGRPIASNDLWIAAQTFERGAELLTFDNDFAPIDGLRVEILKR